MLCCMREPAYRRPPLDGSGAGRSAAIDVYRDGSIAIRRTDCVDYPPADDESGASYFYEFADYEVSMGGVTYSARRYADEWHEVSLFDAEGCSWSELPGDDALFIAAARYFFGLDDVSAVYALGSGEAALDRRAILSG